MCTSVQMMLIEEVAYARTRSIFRTEADRTRIAVNGIECRWYKLLQDRQGHVLCLSKTLWARRLLIFSDRGRKHPLNPLHTFIYETFL